MKDFLIGLAIVILLAISGTLAYFMFIHDDEEEPFEPHPLVKELLESYKIAENYNRERERVDYFYDKGEAVSIWLKDDELIIIILGEGIETHILYTLDQTMVTRNTRLYYEAYLQTKDGWLIDDEAWGQDFRDDEYVQLEMSNQEFIETLEELTIEDWLFFQRELN